MRREPWGTAAPQEASVNMLKFQPTRSHVKVHAIALARAAFCADGFVKLTRMPWVEMQDVPSTVATKPLP